MEPLRKWWSGRLRGAQGWDLIQEERHLFGGESLLYVLGAVPPLPTSSSTHAAHLLSSSLI